LERVAGCGIIAPRRSNSAHLHRPWRAPQPRDDGYRNGLGMLVVTIVVVLLVVPHWWLIGRLLMGC